MNRRRHGGGRRAVPPGEGLPGDPRPPRRTARRVRPIDQSEIEGRDELRELVELATAGDGEAFRRIYQRFAPRLYVYVHFRLGDREAAQDVVQEVFAEVWRQLPRFEDRHANAFPAWVFRIAHNTVVDRLRRRRIRSVPLDEAEAQAVEIEGGAISRRVVMELLERTSPLQRQVVVLRFMAGMKLSEVAAALGKREGAIVQLQLRALRRMRKELREE